jgi:hypothetical protein
MASSNQGLPDLLRAIYLEGVAMLSATNKTEAKERCGPRAAVDGGVRGRSSISTAHNIPCSPGPCPKIRFFSLCQTAIVDAELFIQETSMRAQQYQLGKGEQE